MRVAHFLTVTVAVAGVIGALFSAGQDDEPARPAERTEQRGARTIYPVASPPTITTADGERRPIYSVLNVPRRMTYGDYIWHDEGVPNGPAWIRIDLTAQTLSLFRGGHEIGAAVILYGTDDRPTPTGVFHILERAKQHRSTLYDAEMPFMLRLTSDGVAIHASNVRQGSATHGCIGIPEGFARQMFDQVRRGTVVAIERGGSAGVNAARAQS